MILCTLCSLIKLVNINFMFVIYQINFLICMRGRGGRRIQSLLNTWITMLSVEGCMVSWRSVIHCLGWNVNKNWEADTPTMWHLPHLNITSFSARHCQCLMTSTRFHLKYLESLRNNESTVLFQYPKTLRLEGSVYPLF